MPCGTLGSGLLRFASPTGVSPSSPRLPRHFGCKASAFCRPSTPTARRRSVWALPVSLAATQGISFDYFSSGYLDVSVRPLVLPFGMARHYPCRVAPFGCAWINACLRLPMPFRSLPRPSSTRDAKASAVCPFQLDLLGCGLPPPCVRFQGMSFCLFLFACCFRMLLSNPKMSVRSPACQSYPELPRSSFPFRGEAR